MPGKIGHISVLMPAYNCGEYIKPAIGSILGQTFKEFELIIIDDGSTDNTEEIVSSFKDPRIIYRKTENKGTSAALNYGVTLCNSEWIARIDADDINTPNRLERQIRFIDENPECDIISSWAVYFKGDNKILFLLQEPLYHEEIYKYLDIHNPVNQSAMICRRSLLANNPYNESLTSNEDYELMYRLRDKAVFSNLAEFLVYVRVRENSRTLRGSRDNLYNMLYTNSFKKMVDSKSKGDHFYWASVAAWLNYFYGDRADSRGYFKNSFSMKNLAAYFTTFLPDKYFFKFINSHLKYRIKSYFASKGRYKKELTSLNR